MRATIFVTKVQSKQEMVAVNLYANRNRMIRMSLMVSIASSGFASYDNNWLPARSTYHRKRLDFLFGIFDMTKDGLVHVDDFQSLKHFPEKKPF